MKPENRKTMASILLNKKQENTKIAKKKKINF